MIHVENKKEQRVINSVIIVYNDFFSSARFFGFFRPEDKRRVIYTML